MALSDFLVTFVAVLQFSYLISGQILEDPAPNLSLILEENTIAQLECTYQKMNGDDVIGWVVGDTRISNDATKDEAAIAAALGQEAVSQLVVGQAQSGASFFTGVDFFEVTPAVAGDYKCQLCTNNNGQCGTVLAESTVSEVRVAYIPTEGPTCLPPSTQETRVVLGESVMVSCSSQPGLPVVDLEWFRNSESDPLSSDAVEMDGVLYNNYTFVPTASDDDTSLICRMTPQGETQQSCTASPLKIVSTPTVIVQPPDPAQIPVGSSGTYTCSVVSPTSTPVSQYTWIVEDIPEERQTVNGNRITISDVGIADHGKFVRCDVTDEEGMSGSAEYLILVAGEVVPSDLPTFPPVTQPPVVVTTVPSTTAEPSDGLPIAIIIVIVVVVLLILCVLAGVGWYFYKQNQKKDYPLPRMEKTPPSHTNPDVIPKDTSERPVDVKAHWRESAPPQEHSPTIKNVNMPFQSKGSKTNLEYDPYINSNPAYDDKVDPADLDFKVPFEDREYSDSGIGYRDGDNGYPDEKYGKEYTDGYNDDIPNGVRQYGDGHQDPYSQDYSDQQYAGDYGHVYNDGYDHPTGQYDAYPDRMPDGSEGYEPAPEEYNSQVYDGYNAPADYGQPADYAQPIDYAQPMDYGGEPHQDYGYEGEPGAYDSGPMGYDYQPSESDYPADLNHSYHATPAYDSYYPDRVPDGGVPDGEGYDYGYPPESVPQNGGYIDDYSNDAYNADVGNYHSPHPVDPDMDSYDPSFAEPYHHSQSEPYFDPADEVSATSNPSYV